SGRQGRPGRACGADGPRRCDWIIALAVIGGCAGCRRRSTVGKPEQPGDWRGKWPGHPPPAPPLDPASRIDAAPRVRADTTAATLPLDPRLVGGQLVGLAVLAGAIAMAIARLSLRTQRPQDGDQKSK